METEIRNRPSFANIRVALNAGDAIVAEADAMASMSSTIEMSTRWNGGMGRAILKRLFGGESLFVNEFSTASAGELVLTQSFPGDIECIELKGNTLYLQPGAFIACEPSVSLGIGYAGIASFVGREGLFRLKVSGQGKVWFGAYGGIFEREIEGQYVVDSGHLIAYEPTVSLKMGMAGGIFSSFFSGEGLVTRVNGPGRIYMQSRSMDGLVAWTNRQHVVGTQLCKSKIDARPAASVAKLTLAANEAVTCEVGAMIAMSSGLTSKQPRANGAAKAECSRASNECSQVRASS